MEYISAWLLDIGTAAYIDGLAQTITSYMTDRQYRRE